LAQLGWEPVFLDDLGVQNETRTSHNIVNKKVEVTFQVKKMISNSI
jgi:hypothetical protein